MAAGVAAGVAAARHALQACGSSRLREGRAPHLRRPPAPTRDRRAAQWGPRARPTRPGGEYSIKSKYNIDIDTIRCCPHGLVAMVRVRVKGSGRVGQYGRYEARINRYDTMSPTRPGGDGEGAGEGEGEGEG
jgi:hypothetical protein